MLEESKEFKEFEKFKEKESGARIQGQETHGCGSERERASTEIPLSAFLLVLGHFLTRRLLTLGFWLLAPSP